MKNNEVFAYLERIIDTRIWKLIWIAGNPDREDVEEIIDSMLDDGSFESNFPDIPIDATKHCTQFGDLEELLMDYGKFGFLAQVHFPSIENVMFNKDGSPSFWELIPSLCTIRYVYVECLEELVPKIKGLYIEHFENQIKPYRNEKK